jgi:LacI family transcriptional regulator
MSEEIPLIRCPYCESIDRQVKAGTNNGTQRYKCGACKRRYTPFADGTAYPDSVRAQALQLRTEGKTIREIAHRLGVNHQSVANWLHQQQPANENAENETGSAPSAPTGKQRATIHDVARHADVSPSSVSNYLNQKGRMAESTRQRIRIAMEELHFTPSALVRAIKQRRTHILGVMLRSLDSLNETEGPGSFLVPALLRGINDGADVADNDLLLYTGGRRRHRDDLEARFLGGHIDGLIWMTPEKRTPLLERVVAAGLPVVALMTHEVPEGVSYVTADNKGGVHQLVEHLAAQGHRRLAFVGPDWSTDFRDRHEAYHEAIVALGFPWEPSLQIVVEREKQGFGLEEAREVLAAWLALAIPPTAILCANDHIAAPFAEAIRLRGLRIPDDLALTGFDDMPIAEHIAGGLTTIHQPFRQMGRLAAENLLALVDGKSDTPCQRVLPTELIVRASTTAPHPRSVQSARE